MVLVWHSKALSEYGLGTFNSKPEAKIRAPPGFNTMIKMI